MEIAAITDLGLVRCNNEDFHICNETKGIAVIADGVGGHDYGEVASKIAVESCYQYLTKEDYIEDTSDVEQTLLDSIIFANQQVISYKKDRPKYKKMGTTLNCLYLRENKLSYAWIGDSRVYLVSTSDSTIRMLSEDHNLYNELVRRGEIADSFKKNILTRMVGSNLYTQPEAGQYTLASGDIVLSCTDGLSDLVSDNLLLAAVIECAGNFEQILKKLIELAKGQGGRDNITVALIRGD